MIEYIQGSNDNDAWYELLRSDLFDIVSSFVGDTDPRSASDSLPLTELDWA